MNPAFSLLALAPLAVLAVGSLPPQRGPEPEDAEASRVAYERAVAEQKLAALRSAELEAEASAAVDAVDRTAREAAAVAAQIQGAEAGLLAAETRIALLGEQNRALRLALAERQRPLMQLTASLQNLSRRPTMLAIMQPGSVEDVVHLRAMLDTALPQIRGSTADLRADIARSRALRAEAEREAAKLRSEEALLGERKTELANLEARQRIASRETSGAAAREAERALALAEEARDLDSLVDQFGRAGALRAELAALSGPILRPNRPAEARQANAPGAAAIVDAGGAPKGYRLPVNGQTVAGFGAPTGAGTFSSGLTLAPRGGAQAVSPAAGRVAFAGPYRGYGQIVVIEHEGGWTSLVTGLARADVAVGEVLLAGSPLGIAAPVDPRVTVELRRRGEPVNPLDFLD